MKKIGIIGAICTSLIMAGCVQNNTQTQQDFSQAPSISATGWDNYFSYTCPEGWTIYPNKDYNARVDLSECSQQYTTGSFAFDDGVRVTFGFVPQQVASGVQVADQNYANIKFDEIKNEDNAHAYTNNHFVGRLSLANQKHTLSLIARYPVANGYYEVTADAEGHTYTDKQFQKMIDDIIQTFTPKH